MALRFMFSLDYLSMDFVSSYWLHIFTWMSSEYFTCNTFKEKHLFFSRCVPSCPYSKYHHHSLKQKPPNHCWLFFPVPVPHQSESAMKSISKPCLEPLSVFSFLPLLYQPHFSCLNSPYLPFPESSSLLGLFCVLQTTMLISAFCISSFLCLECCFLRSWHNFLLVSKALIQIWLTSKVSTHPYPFLSQDPFWFLSTTTKLPLQTVTATMKLKDARSLEEKLLKAETSICQ